MPDRRLQDEFLQVFADEHRATANRSVSRLASGGSSLADHGMIRIVDDEGTPFVTHLHEIGFRYYDEHA